MQDGNNNQSPIILYYHADRWYYGLSSSEAEILPNNETLLRLGGQVDLKNIRGKNVIIKKYYNGWFRGAIKAKVYNPSDHPDWSGNRKVNLLFWDGSLYSGKLFDNKPSCNEGYLYKINGDMYVGSFVNGKKMSGREQYKNGVAFIGHFNSSGSYGEPRYGTLKYKNGDVFNGSVSGAQPKKGIMKYKNGDTFCGNFIDGEPAEGHMSYVERDNGGHKISYDGGCKISYENGIRHMEGFVRDRSTGNEYLGSFTGDIRRNEVKNIRGKGTIFYKNIGSFRGTFENDKELTGKGVFRYRSGAEFAGYDGNFVRGVPDGNGTLQCKDGKKIDVFWSNGETTIKQDGKAWIISMKDGEIVKSKEVKNKDNNAEINNDEEIINTNSIKEEKNKNNNLHRK